MQEYTGSNLLPFYPSHAKSHSKSTDCNKLRNIVKCSICTPGNSLLVDNSLSALVFVHLVALGSLRPTAFFPFTLTSYSVEGMRLSRVVDETSCSTTFVSNGDVGFEVGRYSTTYPVMGLPPSFLLAFHWTNMEVEDAASTDTMVGAEGAGSLCDGR